MEHPVDAKEALRQFHEKQTYHYLGGQKDQMVVFLKNFFQFVHFVELLVISRHYNLAPI